MKWPRKGVVIRLAIYIPVIGYLGYQAIGKWKAERETTEQDVAPPQADPLEQHKRVIEMPDGTKREIIELTEDEAEQYLGHPVPKSPGETKSE